MTSNLPDLFPGFAVQRIRTASAEVFARVGGTGPPILMLHGYPQTHVCWYRVAPALAEHFTLVICDLPGYDQSRLRSPEADTERTPYSKRVMAATLVDAMRVLGIERFGVVGHDRGGRVAYRMALDYSGCIERLAVLSILPTFEMWRRLENPEYAMKAFRWFFLAQRTPLPETLIAAAAGPYLHATLADWTADKSLRAFSPEALLAYETAFAKPSTIAAGCGDYRAGWTVDRFDDARDLEAARKIECPALVLWGRAEFADESQVLAPWRTLCTNLRAAAFDCGHFLPEEAPAETAAALIDFFRS